MHFRKIVRLVLHVVTDLMGPLTFRFLGGEKIKLLQGCLDLLRLPFVRYMLLPALVHTQVGTIINLRPDRTYQDIRHRNIIFGHRLNGQFQAPTGCYTPSDALLVLFQQFKEMKHAGIVSNQSIVNVSNHQVA